MFQVTFKQHYINPNLISIIPEGAENPMHNHGPRQNFFRQPHPRPRPQVTAQSFRPRLAAPMIRPQVAGHMVNTAVKLLPQVHMQDNRSLQSKKEVGIKEEEIKEEEGNIFKYEPVSFNFIILYKLNLAPSVIVNFFLVYNSTKK